MTPERLAELSRTAALVERDGQRFAQRFFAHLFALRPGAQRLFPTDRAAEEGTVVAEVVFFAGAAGDLPSCVAHARDLGMRLQQYGVVAADYPALGDALVAAVSDVVGDAWTSNAAAAWRCLYSLVSEAMLEGAAGGLFSARC
jgi:hemoglobin-like flavoprotein